MPTMRSSMAIAILSMGIMSCSANDNTKVAGTEGAAEVTTEHTGLISKTTAYPSSYTGEAEHRGRVERIDYETRYRTYLTSPDLEGIEASRSHRAIGGFSMGGVTTWYALAETFTAFKYYMPMSGDCWSLGAFAGMNRPAATADYLADIVRLSPYAHDFYIWAASCTNDSAYSEILLQVQGMASQTDVFGLDSMTFHEKDDALHEFLPTVEYVYNALPFFFPSESTTGVANMGSNKKASTAKSYSIDGTSSNGHGIVIVNGKKNIKR